MKTTKRRDKGIKEVAKAIVILCIVFFIIESLIVAFFPYPLNFIPTVILFIICVKTLRDIIDKDKRREYEIGRKAIDKAIEKNKEDKIKNEKVQIPD